jgi:hypothetical protein
MPLAASDIVFYPGDAMNDTPGGGGAPRTWPLPTGVTNNLFSGVRNPADIERGSLSLRKVFVARNEGTPEFNNAYAYIHDTTLVSPSMQSVMFQWGETATTRGGTAPRGALEALVTARQYIAKPNEPDMTTEISTVPGRVTLVSGDLVIEEGDLLRFFGATGVHGTAYVDSIVSTGVNANGHAITTVNYVPISACGIRTDTLCVRCEPAPQDPSYYTQRNIEAPALPVGHALVIASAPAEIMVGTAELTRLVAPFFVTGDPPPEGLTANVLPEWGGRVPIFRRGGRVLARNALGQGEMAVVLRIDWKTGTLILDRVLTISGITTVHGLARVSAGFDLFAPEAFWVSRAIQRNASGNFAGSVTFAVRDHGDPFGTTATVELPWDVSTQSGGQGTPPAEPPLTGDITMPSLSPDGTIPAQASYYQTHTLSVTLEATNAPLPVERVSLTIEDGSVCWTLTASGRPSLYDIFAEATTPQLVRVEIDNIDWLFIIESASRTRSGPADRSVTITGRSAAMFAGEPYALPRNWVNDVRTTARTICEDAQDGTGTTIEWHVLDWRVPERVLTFSGSALALVQRVAESIGASVICDRDSNTIYVVARYPRMPSDWATMTPNVVIAETAIRSDAFVRADKPNYTSVWVSGQQQGVLGQVYLAGTDGSAQAPLVTDLLITDSAAVLQRGRSVLGGSGPQARITMSLPVMTGAGRPGVLSPGQIAEVGAWRGIVRSVAVSVALPTVEQTIVVERHFPYPAP